MKTSYPIVVSLNPMLYTDRSGQKWAVSGEHWIEVPETLTLDRVGEYMVTAEPPELPQSREVRTWQVQGSKGNTYTIADDGGTWTCSCPGFGWRRKCKHVEAQKDASR